MYQERFYRNQILSKFKLEISFKESDILVCTNRELDENKMRDSLAKYYQIISGYIQGKPDFKSSLTPLEDDGSAPDIIREMIKASKKTGVGPFASVAGAVAFFVGKEAMLFSEEVIVENGGDIFLNIVEDKRLGVYLGENAGLRSLTLKIRKRDNSFGIASSSSTIGHSMNFGKADLVTVVAKDAILADGFATALSNRIMSEKDAENMLKDIKQYPCVEGVLIAVDEKIFLYGDLEID